MPAIDKTVKQPLGGRIVCTVETVGNVVEHLLGLVFGQACPF